VHYANINSFMAAAFILLILIIFLHLYTCYYYYFSTGSVVIPILGFTLKFYCLLVIILGASPVVGQRPTTGCAHSKIAPVQCARVLFVLYVVAVLTSLQI